MISLDKLPIEEPKVEFGQEEQSLGVGVNKELSNAQMESGFVPNENTILTREGLLISIETDKKLHDLLMSAWNGVNKKTWVFAQAKGDLSQSAASIRYKCAVVEMLAEEVIKVQTLGEVLDDQNSLAFTNRRDSKMLDSDRAVLTEAVLKMCGVHNCRGLHTEQPEKLNRTDLYVQLNGANTAYVLLMSQLGHAPAGALVPLDTFKELANVNVEGSVVQEEPYFSFVPGSKKMAVTPEVKQRAGRTEPEHIYTLPEFYAMYGEGLKKLIVLDKLRKLPKELFVENNKEPISNVSSLEFYNSIASLNDPEVLALHDRLLESFAEAYRLNPEQLVLNPGDPLYRGYHTIVIQAMNPRRANPFAPLITAGKTLLPACKEKEQPAVAYAKENLSEKQYDYLRKKSSELSDLIIKRKVSKNKKGKRTNFTKKELDEIYKFGHFLWDTVFKNLASEEEET